MAGDVDIPSQGQQLMALHRENERLRAWLSELEPRNEMWEPHEPNEECDGHCDIQRYWRATDANL